MADFFNGSGSDSDDLEEPLVEELSSDSDSDLEEPLVEEMSDSDSDGPAASAAPRSSEHAPVRVYGSEDPEQARSEAARAAHDASVAASRQREIDESAVPIVPRRARPMDDDELAEKDSQKALGNGHFVKKQYRAALEAYSMAIDVDPEDHVLFANRSACHLGLAKWTDAAQDAMMCITIDPLYVKGYFRLASAQMSMKQPAAAEETVNKGLKVEPKNRALVKLLHEARKDAKKAASYAKAMSEIRDYCDGLTEEEFKWKSFWAGRGHPSTITNENLHRHVHDVREEGREHEFDKEHKCPDNLPRLDSDDEEDADAMDTVLESVGYDFPFLVEALPGTVGDARSLLTAARFPECRPAVANLFNAHEVRCAPPAAKPGTPEASVVGEKLLMPIGSSERDGPLEGLVHKAMTETAKSLDLSWKEDAGALFKKKRGLGYTYGHFGWRQRVRELEVRVLLPKGCTSADVDVCIEPRRLKVTLKRMPFWPVEAPKRKGAYVDDAGEMDDLDDFDDLDEDDDEDDDAASYDGEGPPPLTADAATEEWMAAREGEPEDAAPATAGGASAIRFKVLWREEDITIKAFELSIDASSTVANLKALLEHESGIPAACQHIAHASKAYGDIADTLPMVYFLQTGDTLVLQERPEGDGADGADSDDSDEGPPPLTAGGEDDEDEDDDDEGENDGGGNIEDIDEGDGVEKKKAPRKKVKEAAAALPALPPLHWAAPREVVLLDNKLAHKVVPDESNWMLSDFKAMKKNLLSGPVLIISLTKFGDWRRGTAQHAGKSWWKYAFADAGEEKIVNPGKEPPTKFFGLKDDE